MYGWLVASVLPSCARAPVTPMVDAPVDVDAVVRVLQTSSVGGPAGPRRGAIRTHVTTERVLYRPSDWVHIRTISVTGPALAPADDGLGPAGVQFELRDPQGVVAREVLIDEVDGVADATLRLPLEGPGGVWTVRAITRDGAVRERPIVVVRPDGAAEPALVPAGPLFGVYPEGGALVEGLPSRVVVEARDAAGAPVDGPGRIVDDTGAVVATFETRRGLSRTALIPTAGHGYRAILDAPAPLEAPLAPPRRDGCVLQTREDVDGRWAALRATVRCARARQVLVVSTHQGELLDLVAVNVPAGVDRGVELVPAGDLALAQGVAWVGVLSTELDLLAERFVYRNRGRDLQVAVHLPDRIVQGEEVEVEVRATDPEGRPVDAAVVVSAIDDAWHTAVDEDRPDIRATLLLEGAIGPVPDAARALDRSDPDSAEDLDRLLAARSVRVRRAPVAGQVPPLPPLEGVRTGYLRPVAPSPGCHLPATPEPHAGTPPHGVHLVGGTSAPVPGVVPIGAMVGAVLRDDPPPTPADPPAPDPFGSDPAFQQCFERERPRTPHIGGSVDITLAYRPDGTVLDVSAGHRGHGAVRECLERVAARRPFDGAREVEGTVTYGDGEFLGGTGFLEVVERRWAPSCDDDLPVPTVLWAPTVRTGPDGVATLTLSAPNRDAAVRIVAEAVGGGLAGWGERVVTVQGAP